MWSIMLVLAVDPPGTDTPRVSGFGVFNDRIVKHDGQWCFEHRLLSGLTRRQSVSSWGRPPRAKRSTPRRSISRLPCLIGSGAAQEERTDGHRT